MLLCDVGGSTDREDTDGADDEGDDDLDDLPLLHSNPQVSSFDAWFHGALDDISIKKAVSARPR